MFWPLFTQPLLPGFHPLSCYYLVSCCFGSLCSIANMNFKGFVLCFGHNGTHIPISITAAPQREAPRRCVLLPRGPASVRLHINTWTGNSYCERSEPKRTISLPVLLTGWHDVRLALCLVIFICSLSKMSLI